jgi:hypothetical protein
VGNHKFNNNKMETTRIIKVTLSEGFVNEQLKMLSVHLNKSFEERADIVVNLFKKPIEKAIDTYNTKAVREQANESIRLAEKEAEAQRIQSGVITITKDEDTSN